MLILNLLEDQAGYEHTFSRGIRRICGIQWLAEAESYNGVRYIDRVVRCGTDVEN